MEYRATEQVKEERIIYAMEHTKQARENLEDLLKLETSPIERRNIEKAIHLLEQARDELRPTRKLYAILAEAKEILNTVKSSFYEVGARLNLYRRPNSPHRDEV